MFAVVDMYVFMSENCRKPSHFMMSLTRRYFNTLEQDQARFLVCQTQKGADKEQHPDGQHHLSYSEKFWLLLEHIGCDSFEHAGHLAKCDAVAAASEAGIDEPTMTHFTS